MRMQVAATTRERKATSSRKKLSASTTAMTIGWKTSIMCSPSTKPAVVPPT